MGKSFTNYRIEERSYVSYVKREIHMEVSKSQFTGRQVGEIDIIVSELTSNLVKHAGNGEILYRVTEDGEDKSVFEVISLDKGPGMNDPQRMLKDGVSTAGTLGHGLGAISRLSTLSQIYSTPGAGTIIYAMVSTQLPKFVRKVTPELEVRSVCVAKPRETECGDGYRIKDSPSDTVIFFGDGLGHGREAKAAIDAAGNFFMTTSEREPVEILRQMHEKVRRTRGLVASIAFFDKSKSEWRICGVGNIMIRMYQGIQYKNYMSYNGTIGLNIPTSIKESVFPGEKNQHLLMCSDGIRTRFDLNGYHSIFKHDGTVVAAALYRDFARGTDDASVLIAKVV